MAFARGSFPLAVALGGALALMFVIALLPLPILGSIFASLLAGIVAGLVARGGPVFGAATGFCASLVAVGLLAAFEAVVVPLLPLTLQLTLTVPRDDIFGFQALFIVTFLTLGSAISAGATRQSLPEPKPQTWRESPAADLVPAPSPPTREQRITCPRCAREFVAQYAELPHPIECPSCGKRGVLR